MHSYRHERAIKNAIGRHSPHDRRRSGLRPGRTSDTPSR
ncbi:hypothetical protein NJ7G_2000 [Natrinema sp. J7-2]|nr:hypothetical protein NJ7G_2000 [Natrinema sp. J7-2]